MCWGVRKECRVASVWHGIRAVGGGRLVSVGSMGAGVDGRTGVRHELKTHLRHRGPSQPPPPNLLLHLQWFLLLLTSMARPPAFLTVCPGSSWPLYPPRTCQALPGCQEDQTGPAQVSNWTTECRDPARRPLARGTLAMSWPLSHSS